jgi:hypothetical protein
MYVGRSRFKIDDNEIIHMCRSFKLEKQITDAKLRVLRSRFLKQKNFSMHLTKQASLL